MLNICLKRLSFIILSRRTITTNDNNSTINNVIKRLTMNYRKELDQLSVNENESTIERIQYLKTILKSMNLREKILQDISETEKFSNGKINLIAIFLDIHYLIEIYFDRQEKCLSFLVYCIDIYTDKNLLMHLIFNHSNELKTYFHKLI